MNEMLPVVPAVTSVFGRILLAGACIGIAAAACAMVKVHGARYELTARRASLFAGASLFLSLVALAAALFVGAPA